MQHDIYSLGVCLLEVGMWESLVYYNDDLTTIKSSIVNELPEGCDSITVKDSLVHFARIILPQRIGTKYARVADTCLTCLDEENVDFGDEREFQDADGILVGARYIEKVDDPASIALMVQELTRSGTPSTRGHLIIVQATFTRITFRYKSISLY